MAYNNSISSIYEADFYSSAFITYGTLMFAVFAQCEDCEITKVLTIVGYADVFLLMFGTMSGLISRRMRIFNINNDPNFPEPCFNIGTAAGFLTINALLAIGATVAYLRDGDSYTARRLNIGAVVAGALFFIIPILRILNHCCDSRNEENEDWRPLHR